jgi:hypothetical protein
MSTIKVSNIQNASTSSGGIAIDTSGHVTVDGVAYPSAGSLSGRNRIINGDMRIDQRNAGAAVTSSTAYPVDRWINYGATDGTYAGQQSTDVPTGQGFSNSLKYTVTTADATIGATQYASIGQRIEGYNTADLMLGTANAKQFTVSFWVKSSVAGTYGFALQNTAGDRGYATTYSIASTDTWEYKTLVITGDTTGTWLSDNSIGLRTTWGLGIGSTYTVSANNTWEAGIKFGAVGATNLMATLNATFYITGVQLEAGSVATPFERRSYGQELSLCQRYYYRIRGSDTSISNQGIYGNGWSNSSTQGRATFELPVTMRTFPTALEQSGTASDYRYVGAADGGIVCSAVPQYISASTKTVDLNWTIASGATARQGGYFMSNTANSYLGVSAEL